MGHIVDPINSQVSFVKKPHANSVFVKRDPVTIWTVKRKPVHQHFMPVCLLFLQTRIKSKMRLTCCLSFSSLAPTLPCTSTWPSWPFHWNMLFFWQNWASIDVDNHLCTSVIMVITSYWNPSHTHFSKFVSGVIIFKSVRCAQILLIFFYSVPAQCHNKMHCWVTSSQKCSHTYTVRRVDTLTIFPFAWMFCRVFCAVSNLRFGSSGISPKPWCSAHSQTSCLLWMLGYTVPLETEPWGEGRSKIVCKNISRKRHWEPETSFHICMQISKCADGGDQSDKRCKKERNDDITSSHVRAGDFWGNPQPKAPNITIDPLKGQFCQGLICE